MFYISYTPLKIIYFSYRNSFKNPLFFSLPAGSTAMAKSRLQLDYFIVWQDSFMQTKSIGR